MDRRLAGLAFVVVLFCAHARAATYYVSQNGGSVNCGADGTQSTQNVAWFNAAGHYSSGDTLKLCGTFTAVSTGTTMLTVQSSGVTIYWESNASLTSPAWGSAINTNGKTGLTFDGGDSTNSIIATANGSSRTYQQDSAAISASGCDNCEFKNLKMRDIYVHLSNGTGNNGVCLNTDGNALYYHDNLCDNAYIGFNFYPNSKNVSNVRVVDNHFDHTNWAVYINGNGTAQISNTLIYGNHDQNHSNWDRASDWPHHDGFFVVHNGSSGTISGTYIYNNLFSGEGSTCSPNSCMTASIYFNTRIDGMYIFNNNFLTTSVPNIVEGGWPGDQNIVIVNNYAEHAGVGVKLSDVSNLTIENNAFNDLYTYLFVDRAGGTITVDHNVYDSAGASTGHAFKWNAPGGDSFSAYRAAHPTLDVHTITPSSLGVTNGVPQAGSALIHDGSNNFENLTALCSGSLAPLCSDMAGAARPVSGTHAWDAGAYQYGSSGASSASLSPPSLTFASRSVGTTSPAQAVTLTNNGTATLNISSIAANGDFAVASTSPSGGLCGGNLAAGNSCTIQVTFTPTQTGARSGTLSISDNAAGSPHTVSLSGTGTAAQPGPKGVRGPASGRGPGSVR